jgi:drug/metabolite transporter (DMT)-like permease
VIGAALLRRWRTTGLAIVVGGLFLVLFGGVHTGGGSSANPLQAIFASYVSAIGSVVGTASRRTDIIRASLFAAGAVVLLGFGLWRWDGVAGPDAPAAAAPDAAAAG